MGAWQYIVWANIGVLLSGLIVTAKVCAIAFAVSLILGLCVCLVRMYVPVLRPIAVVYIEFFRATPIYVQLMWVAYVWPSLFGWPNDFFSAGWAALALQSSGYLAETFRAGLEGIGKGQLEAAHSTGLSRRTILFRVLLPQVYLAISPSLVNQFIVIVKSSTLVSVIGITDLMFETLKLVNTWYQPVEVLTATAALYVVFIAFLSHFLKILSDRYRQRFGIDFTSSGGQP